jgi:hypothetical protein
MFLHRRKAEKIEDEREKDKLLRTIEQKLEIDFFKKVLSYVLSSIKNYPI